MSQPLRVLIVEDFPDDVELLLFELQEGGFFPIHYERVDSAEAMRTALEAPQGWDIIICDHCMRNFNSLDALALMKEKGLDIPFIIVSGTISEALAVSAMKAGAQDYVYKGNLTRLIPAVSREVKEAKVRQEHRKTQERLKYLNSYDHLTGLPNRNFFLNSLRECIDNNQKHSGELFAVLFLNVDRFQMIKYSLGQALSEQFLIATAQRLQEWLKSPHLLARMRGDEFIILLLDIKDARQALDLADEIHQAFSKPFNLDGRVVYSTSSIGIVLGNIDYQNPEDFLRAADIAKHHAQKKTTSRSVLYDASMQRRVSERLQLETDLQQAIQNQELYLHYQPIVSLETGEITAFEALLRWHHPTRGLISPAEFIPLAEETGLIIPLGQWALSQACQRLRLWQEEFPHLSALSMSVNLSGVQLSNPDLIKQIDELLESVGLCGDSLKLEITESFLMENMIENPLAANQILKQLKERQIKLCIDDFGTGYSSLSYLHHLPIDILKIDRSFLNSKTEKGKNSEIVKSIVNLAKDLGLALVAEGIETEKQLTMLKQLQCDYGQGYLFAKPLDVHTLYQLFDQQAKSLN
ncbi:response regulator receiver modulated diguanylate cyclase/phosphodiesterase [Gloeothece citriformis PCC 7424]|uniref:Response regulator receiver modulated diguanylate cyclase/phosphodiesterase n=1 Tax=Gloeothece citriformis (strain PCC 7424) TaxID=65393 RepID=B7KI79_GLOC7|nr:EAL domain-containing protein [Gloeothece citriformis]ACK73566.1 response regulator receiver modulated diguanylate cyclase/phosphodiesterase [Gloeothece citriformis PCC 7424]